MLSLVPTPIGNLNDISKRALACLSKAEVFLCEDTRVTKKLINLLNEKYSLNIRNKEFISLREHNQKRFLTKVQKEFFLKDIAYLSDAGMPSVSDPGAELVNYCIKNNIKIEVLPGANALLLAYVYSGFIDKRFLFFGFLPHKGKEREEELLKALNSGYITILYEAPHRLLKLLKEISDIEKDRIVFIAKELSKMHEKYYRAKATKLYELMQKENIKGEWVVVLEKKEKENFISLRERDILKLDIPIKIKAKLLSKITGENTKNIYQRLIN